jgi:hypothetical protein
MTRRVHLRRRYLPFCATFARLKVNAHVRVILKTMKRAVWRCVRWQTVIHPQLLNVPRALFSSPQERSPCGHTISPGHVLGVHWQKRGSQTAQVGACCWWGVRAGCLHMALDMLHVPAGVSITGYPALGTCEMLETWPPKRHVCSI